MEDSTGRRLGLIANVTWPSFMAACLLELLVFAFVDPLELHWAGHGVDLSRMGAYTVAFFAFWAICCAACAVTAWMNHALRD
jgi:hypothetical protein